MEPTVRIAILAVVSLAVMEVLHMLITVHATVRLVITYKVAQIVINLFDYNFNSARLASPTPIVIHN